MQIGPAAQQVEVVESDFGSCAGDGA